MRQIPILFSTPMVKALIEGRKTQTRRIVKSRTGYFQVGIEKETKRVLSVWATDDEEMWQYDMSCPYGETGDRIYVKETHYRYGHWRKDGLTKTGKQKWRFCPDLQFTEVRFIDNPPAKIEKNSHRGVGWYKRSSLFMPKEAARIWLEITSVSVERLQDISEQDAKAEGVRDSTEPIYPKDFSLCPECGGEGTHGALGHNLGVTEVDCTTCDTFKKRFQFLWKFINGPESWKANPFVWKIEFKVLSTTGKPQ